MGLGIIGEGTNKLDRFNIAALRILSIVRVNEGIIARTVGEMKVPRLGFTPLYSSRTW